MKILRVIPVEQGTLNEAFCDSSGRRGKFADFEVLEMWPPLSQPQKPRGNDEENTFPWWKLLGSLLSLLETALFPGFSLSEAMQLRGCFDKEISSGEREDGKIWGLSAQKEPQRLPEVSVPAHSHPQWVQV